MEERIARILESVDERILTYDGDNLFDAGLLDSFLVIGLVGDLEDEFDIKIDAKLVYENNFKTKDAIIALVRQLI